MNRIRVPPPVPGLANAANVGTVAGIQHLFETAFRRGPRDGALDVTLPFADGDAINLRPTTMAEAITVRRVILRLAGKAPP